MGYSGYPQLGEIAHSYARDVGSNPTLGSLTPLNILPGRQVGKTQGFDSCMRRFESYPGNQ